MKKNALFILPFFAVSFVAAAQQSDNKGVGAVSASFLQVSPSVRAAALGGSQAALEGTGDAMFSNPAALNSLSAPELFFSHNESLLDSEYDSIGFVLPRSRHALGFSAQYINDGTFEKAGEDGSQLPVFGLGTFRHSTLLLNTGAAFNVMPNVAAGGLLKGWQEQMDGSSTGGWAMDAGVQIRSILNGLNVAFAARNLGPSIDGKQLPVSLAAGGAYTIKLATLFTEVEMASHQDAAVRVGLELKQDYFSLRGGFENLTSDLEDSLSQFTFGAGVRIKGSKIDYAFVPRGELGDEHRVSVSFGFGLSDTDKARVAKEVDRTMAQRMEQRAQDHCAQGEKAFATGNWDEAVARFTSALEWAPASKRALDGLNAAKQKQIFSTAATEYEKGLRLKNKGQFAEAAVSFEKVLDLMPSHKEAGQQLAAVRAKLDNADFLIEKAKRIAAEKEVERLKQVASPGRDELDIMDQQANTLFSLGQTQKAIEMWQEVLRRDPSRESVQNALKAALRKKDVQGEVSASTRKVNEINSKAMAAYGNGDLNQAAQLWRQALQMDPQNVWTKRALSRVEMEMAGAKE